MADEMERIEKALEGNGLALSAVAEVLHKMDARFAKAEEDEDKKREEDEIEEAAVEKAALVKELATEVANMLKADQGMDVDPKERKAKTTGGSSSNADDSESAANINSKIDQQQNTIQAMRKEEDKKDEEEEYPVDESKGHDDEEEDDDAKKAGYQKAGDDDEDDEDDEIKSMQKELESLRLQLAEFENGLEKAVEAESESRLRKMGFREETGLVAPKQTHPLGTDGTTPIVKSDAPEEAVDQLMGLSYGELRRLQMKIQAGDTAGVPRELLN